MIRVAPTAPRFLTVLGNAIIGTVNATAFCLFGAIIAVTIAQAILNRSSGPLALTSIFYPYLFLPALVLLPFIVFPRTLVLRLSLVGLAVLYLIGPGVGRWPVAAAAPGSGVSFLSWNILATNRDTSMIRNTIANSGALVAGVQELRTTQAVDFETDPALLDRYPHRILRPARDYSGMGLFSALPIEDQGYLENPPTIWARVTIEGQPVLVVNSHPFPGRLMTRRLAGIPVPAGFDPYGRDDAIDKLLDLIRSVQQPGEAILLMGDFNVTDREPVYQRLTANLVDVHAAVGYGPGTTWKTPVPALWGYGVGLLRIDYQFASRQLQPVSFQTNCAESGSDHCAVTGAYRLAR